MNAIQLEQVRCRFCQYEWLPRVARPRSCPYCKRRSPVEALLRKNVPIINQEETHP